jgi:glycosyltransferase involved in cell wall biosynthesis
MQDEFVISVVMITVPERREAFNRIVLELNKQIQYCKKVHPTLGKVELVKVEGERFDKGGLSIGAKRQQGLNSAKGKYVCWLDDDDWVSPDYIETLLRLAGKDSDVLVFNNISRFEGFWCIVQMNLDFVNDEQVKPGIVHRRPYHVCAFRRSILKDCIFPNANWDEDTGFLAQVWPKLKSQSKTEAILHEYNRLTKSIAWESVQ